MKKRNLIITTLAICLIILFGCLLIIFINQKNFETIVEDDIENISKLSTATIYGEIDNSLTKPIFVGQTIVSDLLLKNILKEEPASGENQEYARLIQDYLAEYQKKYGYDSVSLISAKSNIYYHFDGINKIVSRQDAHDVWYYDFIESGNAYKLNVDVDEVNNELTIFVDSRIEAPDGTLLGVVGVGVKMSHLQAMLEKYETDYDLKAVLINKEGVVQVDSNKENIETVNFFNDPFYGEFKEEILNNKNSMEIHWFPKKAVGSCLITQYIENLDWYIVIEKTTSQLKSVLTAQFHQDLLFIAVIILLVLLISSVIINQYNRLLIKTATTDEVTDLPNAKMFYEMYRRNLKRAACRQGTFFIFDIDHFKKINDENGHLFGNTVLYNVSAMVKEMVGNKGIVARWGGDEFVGIIYAPPETADAILQSIIKVIADDQKDVLKSITVSLGATRICGGDKLNIFIKEVDMAMYCSKANGRNQISYYEKK